MIPQSVSISARASGRDNHFNLIRFIAASSVLVSHAWPIALGPGTLQPLEVLLAGHTLGAVAVIVFFAVSGYFIAQSFDRSRSAVVFLAARGLRLFPALLIMLTLTVLGGALLTTVGQDAYWPDAVRYFLRNATLFAITYELSGVFATNPYGGGINGSLWTLRHEVACYFTVLAAGILRLPGRVISLLALAGLGALSIVGPDQVFASGAAVKFAELALPFWVGSALYFWRDLVPHSVLLLALLVGTAALGRGTAFFDLTLAAVLAYGAIWAGFAPARPLLAFNRMGDFSYGIYIYAFPVQQLAAYFGAVSPWSNMLWSAPTVLILSALSWHLIEEPVLRLKPRGRVATRVESA